MSNAATPPTEGAAPTPPPAAGGVEPGTILNAKAAPPAGNDGAGTAPAPGSEKPEPSWRDSLPEDVRGLPALKNFKDVGQLVQSYLHAQKMVTGEKILKPGKNATQSEWDAYYAAGGRPESPDKYELKLPEKHNEGLVKAFRETAHKLGLNSKQAQGLLEMYDGQNQAALQAQSEAQAKAKQEGIKALREEWGQGWDKEVRNAQRGVQEFAPDGMAEKLMEKYHDDPDFARLMAKVGASLGEDKIKGNGATNHFGMTPREMQARINQIQGHAAYLDKDHPEHRDLIAERSRLFEALYPSQTG
jgi:hypothetical protein